MQRSQLAIKTVVKRRAQQLAASVLPALVPYVPRRGFAFNISVHPPLATRRQCAGAAPLAQPLFFWPHVTRAAVAGDTNRRGGFAVVGGGLACSGAAGQSPVGA